MSQCIQNFILFTFPALLATKGGFTRGRTQKTSAVIRGGVKMGQNYQNIPTTFTMLKLLTWGRKGAKME